MLGRTLFLLSLSPISIMGARTLLRSAYLVRSIRSAFRALGAFDKLMLNEAELS